MQTHLVSKIMNHNLAVIIQLFNCFMVPDLKFKKEQTENTQYRE